MPNYTHIRKRLLSPYAHANFLIRHDRMPKAPTDISIITNGGTGKLT